ncbi:hypothetical protein [Aquamicrobium sp. LC103]|uniref:hypothetical protein n=1 Tax=Aquamicrobium sp. LC103 TaxID=1120658 RepID=UPI000AD17183|nr:hypothetical protein [Aquamicrobium sp. LC103]TKT79182.1 hypothetical protein XW59_009630 [Aquamicrobium sp. LC103]
MLTRCIALALFTSLVTSPASAALAGYYDSARVLHAVLGHDDVADALRQQPIATITQTEDGYRLESRDCAVEVVVHREAGSQPGPGSFRLDVGQGKCAAGD